MLNRTAFEKSLINCSLLILVMFALTACGGAPSAPPPSEAKKSETAQKSIEDFITAAKKSPKTAAQELSVLMESLDAYATEYEGPYVALRDSAKELLGLYESKASKDKINAQLDVLKQKADALSTADE